MGHRLIAVVLGALGLGAGLFVLLDARRGDDGRVTVPHRQSAKTSAREPSLASPRAPGGAAIEQERRRMVEPAPTAPAPAKSRSASRRVELTGTFAVEDAAGAVHANTKGSFRLTRHRPARVGLSRSRRVFVRGGRWSVDVKPDAELEVSEVRLGDRLAELDLTGVELPLRVPEEGGLDLRARWVPECMLRVRAEDTGIELAQVDVVRNAPRSSSSALHPGAYRRRDVVVRSAASPIEMGTIRASGSSLRQVFYVGSPGFAWKRVTVDLRDGGEVEVDLQPGGALDVTLIGHDPRDGPVLRLRKHGATEGKPELELPLRSSDTVALESLPVGRYAVSVEVGPWKRDPVVRGWGEAEVVAGARARLALRLAPALRALLAGLLIIPPAWELDDFFLRLSPESDRNRNQAQAWTRKELEAVAGRDGAYRWSAGEVKPGRYTLNVGRLWSTSVEVGRDDIPNLILAVPPPCDVELRLTDQRTGRDADVTELTWRAIPGGSLKRVVRSPGGAFRFRSPPGSIRVELWEKLWKYDLPEPELAIGPGLNRHTLMVSPHQGIELEFRLEGRAASWAEHPWIVESWDRGRWRSEGMRLTMNQAGVRLLLQPGRHRVRCNHVAGFVDVEPREVLVEAGEFTQLVIELERAP